MQRLNHEQYKYGYKTEMDMQIEHVWSGLEMVAPIYLATRQMVDAEGVNLDLNVLAIFAALVSLYSACSRARDHYGAHALPELEASLEQAANQRHVDSRRRLCLFGRPENVDAKHSQTRASVSLLVASITMLGVVNGATLLPYQDRVAGIMVFAALIASYELFVNLQNTNFGAQAVEVDLSAYRASPPLH